MQSGLDPEECARLVPCNCNSRVLLEHLGGHIVEANEKIPADQVWYSDPKTGQIRRFRKHYDRGYLAFEMLPSVCTRAKEDADGHHQGETPSSPDPDPE